MACAERKTHALEIVLGSLGHMNVRLDALLLDAEALPWFPAELLEVLLRIHAVSCIERR